MIAVPAGVRVLVATKPVDFRRGADRLAALVGEQLKHDPFSGTIFIFRSKRADRLKILTWDGSGLVLLWKRLEHGAFRWPPISDGVMRLTASQLAALVDGMDWSRLHAHDVPRPTATSSLTKTTQLLLGRLPRANRAGPLYAGDVTVVDGRSATAFDTVCLEQPGCQRPPRAVA
jgi:transposase